MVMSLLHAVFPDQRHDVVKFSITFLFHDVICVYGDEKI